MIMIIMMMMIIIITIIIHYHPLSSIIIHYHPLSSIINHYHPLSSIIIHYYHYYYYWWWWWTNGYQSQYWDSHPLASVEHVPRTLCQVPVRLPRQWSPVTSCAKLSGELSQDCPIIHIYIHIYNIYNSISFYGYPIPNISPLWSVKSYIYIHTVFISPCVFLSYTQDSFCFIADMSEKTKRRTVPGSGVSTHFRVRPCEL